MNVWDEYRSQFLPSALYYGRLALYKTVETTEWQPGDPALLAFVHASITNWIKAKLSTAFTETCHYFCKYFRCIYTDGTISGTCRLERHDGDNVREEDCQ